MEGTPSRVARVAAIVGVAAAAFFALGPALIQLGLLSGFVGFRLFMLGALLGVVALVLGAVGLLRTREASGRSGRGAAMLATGIGLAILGIVFVTAGSAGGLPAINDITTNPDDPPAFSEAARTQAGRDLGYPGEAFASAQREAYPDLEPIRLVVPPDQCWTLAEQAADALGWEITWRDAPGGRLEATETTRIFRFVDDVAVRVRPGEGGCVIDVRSKSRDGRGDLGANAARIRAFREKLR